MKAKSTSVQNFDHLVKQVIDGTGSDNDETEVFHRMIYEKWRFKMSLESKSAGYKRSSTKQLEQNQQNISATVAHRRSRRPKYKRSPVNVELTRGIGEREDSETLQVQTFLSNNDEQTTTTNPKDNFNEQHDICFAPVTGPTDSIIEIWSKSLKRTHRLPNANAKNKDSEKDRIPNRINGSPNQKPNEQTLTFDAWKKKKTVEYKRKLKEIEAQRQQKLQENQTKAEWKRAIQQQQLWKKERMKNERNLRLLSKKHVDMFKGGNMINKPGCDENKEGRNIDRHGLDALDERKKAELEKKKTPTMPTTRQKTKTVWPDDPREKVTFYTCLNQLDWILHKKYIRERRHLVRSFYCQPFYYGNANF